MAVNGIQLCTKTDWRPTQDNLAMEVYLGLDNSGSSQANLLANLVIFIGWTDQFADRPGLRLGGWPGGRFLFWSGPGNHLAELSLAFPHRP